MWNCEIYFHFSLKLHVYDFGNIFTVRLYAVYVAITKKKVMLNLSANIFG